LLPGGKMNTSLLFVLTGESDRDYGNCISWFIMILDFGITLILLLSFALGSFEVCCVIFSI
jgi:hypothetical protein